FHSLASNLTLFDFNDASDIYLYDVDSDTHTLVSVGINGVAADDASISPSVSDSGKFVAFSSSADNLVAGDTNSVADIFLRDINGATTTRVSISSASAEADGPSTFPSISSDGKRVVFASSATNLVSGDTNNVDDIFLRDLNGSTTTRV